VFANVPYNVCDPSLYPTVHLLDGFSLLLDFNKNHQQMAGGPRAVWRSTYPQGRCCVLTVFKFLSAHTPAPDSPMLSVLGTRLSTATINAVFKATAVLHHLDPKRLLPHPMRFGVICQLDSAGFDDATKMRQGDWPTFLGMHVYCHAAINYAKCIANTLHYAALISIHYSQHTYATVLPGTPASRHVPTSSLAPPTTGFKRTRLR
jgi:hypothetical protein